jgi:hypothetical protein
MLPLTDLLGDLVTATTLIVWVLLTARVKGWAWLHAVLMRPGTATVKLLHRAACKVLTPAQWRLLAAHARVAQTRYQCWRLGIKIHPR